jgi:hypothetical protein
MNKPVEKRGVGVLIAGALPVLCRCFTGALPVLCRCFYGALPVLCRCFAVALPVFCRTPVANHANEQRLKQARNNQKKNRRKILFRFTRESE